VATAITGSANPVAAGAAGRIARGGEDEGEMAAVRAALELPPLCHPPAFVSLVSLLCCK